MTGEPAAVALPRLVSRNRRRYGGYLIHGAAVLVFMGITVSSTFQEQKDLVIRKGEAAAFGDRSFRFLELNRKNDGARDVTEAVLGLEEGGLQQGQIRAVKDVYPIERQVWTRPAIRSNLFRDIYVTLSEVGGDGSWVAVNVKVNPMVMWIWLGGAVLAAAALVYLAPSPSPLPSREGEGSR
jgi:cytochrome c-type biogenesis protein CcmF